MKIKLDIDATPQELRAFFGLPDVAPFHDEMMRQLQEKMLAGVDGYDPLSLLGRFVPQGVQSLETMQKLFWEAMRSQLDAAGRPPGKP